MCFDCGVYGLKGMEFLFDVFCDVISSEKIFFFIFLVVEDNIEMIDVVQFKDDVLSIVLFKIFEIVKEDEVYECDFFFFVEGFEVINELIKVGYFILYIDELIFFLISINVIEESCQGSISKSDFGDVVEINCDIVE